ncbi:unnamed protein product [Euphydryas editha]|uniref:Uncharacterized protein n=1 Tax=Euphydryas editha TaxID=104508 RepID=A0AAU9VC35_EUPED|nr:unnamed protein product [Euphydryas editha]
MLIDSGSKCNSPLEKSFPKFRGVTVQIPIDQSVKPVVQPYRRIPIPLEEKVAKKLKELKDADIIEEVNEPSPWVSPIVPVLKERSRRSAYLCRYEESQPSNYKGKPSTSNNE